MSIVSPELGVIMYLTLGRGATGLRAYVFVGQRAGRGPLVADVNRWQSWLWPRPPPTPPVVNRRAPARIADYRVN